MCICLQGLRAPARPSIWRLLYVLVSTLFLPRGIGVHSRLFCARCLKSRRKRCSLTTLSCRLSAAERGPSLSRCGGVCVCVGVVSFACPRTHGVKLRVASGLWESKSARRACLLVSTSQVSFRVVIVHQPIRDVSKPVRWRHPTKGCPTTTAALPRRPCHGEKAR